MSIVVLDILTCRRYKKAVDYWDGQEASYNGVLGGFGFVSDIDVRDSRELIQKVR
jgi:protein N-terminal methyltransferase